MRKPVLCCSGIGQAHPSVLHCGVILVSLGQEDAGIPETPVRGRAVGEEDPAGTGQQSESAAVCAAAACVGHWGRQVVVTSTTRNAQVIFGNKHMHTAT